MPIFTIPYASLNSIEAIAKEWIEEQKPAEDALQLFLSNNIYLFTGGRRNHEGYYLNAQYCICRKLKNLAGVDHGYAFYKFNSRMGLQLREIVIKEKMANKENAFLVMFPHKAENRIYDPITEVEYISPRYVVSCQDVPVRRPFLFSDYDVELVLGATYPDTLLEVATDRGIKIKEDDAAELISFWEKSFWKNMNTKQKILLFARFYRNYHYQRFGSHDALYTGTGAWPYSDPSFPNPDAGDNLSYLNKDDVVRARNFLANIPFHAHLYCIDYDQENAIERSLVDLGLDDRKGPSQADSSMWVGRSSTGKLVQCVGAIRIASTWLHFVNVYRGVEIGEVIYRDNDCTKALGKVTSVLWKSINHAYFVKPEEQRGIGVVLTR